MRPARGNTVGGYGIWLYGPGAAGAPKLAPAAWQWQSPARVLKKTRAAPIVDLEMTARESTLRVSQGESVMQFMRRVLGCGRDLLLALWAIGVLAFCVLGLAGAMH